MHLANLRMVYGWFTDAPSDRSPDDGSYSNLIPNAEVARHGFVLQSEAALAQWLRRAAALPQALRASHAKPWAECASDAERLDVYNGFLLSANLDVLFDSFLISFTDEGELLVSEVITPSDQQKMGLATGMHLRWVSAQHGPYLHFHRKRFLHQVTRSY